MLHGHGIATAKPLGHAVWFDACLEAGRIGALRVRWQSNGFDERFFQSGPAGLLLRGRWLQICRTAVHVMLAIVIDIN